MLNSATVAHSALQISLLLPASVSPEERTAENSPEQTVTQESQEAVRGSRRWLSEREVDYAAIQKIADEYKHILNLGGPPHELINLRNDLVKALRLPLSKDHVPIMELTYDKAGTLTQISVGILDRSSDATARSEDKSRKEEKGDNSFVRVGPVEIKDRVSGFADMIIRVTPKEARGHTLLIDIDYRDVAVAKRHEVGLDKAREFRVPDALPRLPQTDLSNIHEWVAKHAEYLKTWGEKPGPKGDAIKAELFSLLGMKQDPCEGKCKHRYSVGVQHDSEKKNVIGIDITSFPEGYNSNLVLELKIVTGADGKARIQTTTDRRSEGYMAPIPELPAAQVKKLYEKYSGALENAFTSADMERFLANPFTADAATKDAVAKQFAKALGVETMPVGLSVFKSGDKAEVFFTYSQPSGPEVYLASFEVANKSIKWSRWSEFGKRASAVRGLATSIEP